MSEKTNLSEMVEKTGPIQHKKPNPNPMRKAKQTQEPNKKRVWVYLDPSIHELAHKRVKQGYAPDQHLSPLINRLLKNWTEGRYDNAHEELGWFDED